MKSVIRKVRELYAKAWVNIVHFAIVTNGINYFTAQYTGEPVYHLSGLLAGAAGRTIDLISTASCARTMHSEDGKKYNLDKIFHEASPILGRNPTPRDVKRAIPLNLAVVVLSGIFPTFGYAFASRDLVCLINNRETRKEMDRVIQLRREAENQ